jgi:D-3-phosphoglycerate dehydrogenase
MLNVVIARSNLPGLENERAILEAMPAAVIDRRHADDGAILDACREADGVITDYFRFDRDTLAQMPRCRVICQYGIGVDAIDVAAATELGILVGYTPGYCEEEVADHALCLLLALARRVFPLDRSVRDGHWDYNLAGPVHRLRGQTLGLVGFGAIARKLAARAQALGLVVLAHDPFVPEHLAAERDVQLCGLDDLLAQADFVSLHAPATPQTRHIVDREALARMKRSAFLINTARGVLVDQATLLQALREGQIAGAALDVLEQEPPPASDPILESESLILTPHAAFYSLEAIMEVQRRAAQVVADVLRGKRPAALVNPEAIGRRVHVG